MDETGWKNQIGRDTVIEVDLDALEHNIRQFRRHLKENVKVMAVVKADAYGHGAVQVARTALQAGASYLAVAFVDEAVELRNAGIAAPILILGYTPPRAISTAVQYDLTCTVYSRENLRQMIETAKRAGKTLRVHVKVDTGMGRLGLFPEDVLSFVRDMVQSPYIDWEGIFTHYATADEADKEYALKQEQKFRQVVESLTRENLKPKIAHIANSAGSIDLRERTYNMVRLGISMYGLYPSAEVNRQSVSLKPILTLKTKVASVKKPVAGTGISYGKTYIVNGEEWVAALPIGYADGINRRLSNRGHVLIAGKKVPIIGRICMDQLMVNVTEIMPVEVGQEVVVYGKQQGAEITVDEVADLLDTINYEVTCMLSSRIPRVYKRNGKVVDIVNRLRENVLLNV
ncbi:alanine racemase [Thermoactinomyces sp. AMNI-1]|uniref:Alanine racemase n=2 Tax=Thermoactinomyces mirandus TaxID=2756294 RepID=A0A7W1XU45_9BACL|nr:alanine racemase [Thermoactinomyces mirandus]